MSTEGRRNSTIAKLKHIRDSWSDEHDAAVIETDRAHKHERTALKRFQEVDKEYQAALKRNPDERPKS